MYQSNPRAPIPRSYPADLKLFDSRLEALDLKLFDSFSSRKFDAKLRPPDSTSVFATESFCLPSIETETYKCGFVVRREFSFNVLSVSVTRNLLQMTYFSKERFHCTYTHQIQRTVCCFTMSLPVWSSWIKLYVS